jgi:dCMP deaminase
VKDRFVLATGYNGSLPGTEHCEDAGCWIINNHCIRTNHAEINAIAQAAHHGISVQGATAYVTNMPCTTCAKAVAAAGIKRIVIFSEYHDTKAEFFLKEARIPLDRLTMPTTKIHYDLESYTSTKVCE